jgi:hypothetical protein
MKWKRAIDALVKVKRIKKHKGDCYSPKVARYDLSDDAPITDFDDDPIDDDDTE